MMKKNIIAATLLTVLALFFASCEKQPVNEWNRFYGYTQDDIVGHFEANPDESLYQDLPTEGVAVYKDATIDISAVGSTSISLHIVIPGKVNKTFSGPIDMTDENRSDIALLNIINNTNKEDIRLTVYKNDNGQVRFHGVVKRYYYSINADTGNLILDRSDNWGFDVIKQ
jgi:hypothetical protein